MGATCCKAAACLDQPVEIGCFVLCKFFFVHRRVFFQAGPLPPYQALRARRDGCLDEVEISLPELERGKLARSRVVASHRWLTKSHPDPDGVQREAIKSWLEANPEVEWVWLDFCCLPQETEEYTRTPEEKRYFRDALNFSNTLYLFLPVLVLADSEYIQRFWCLLEAFLALRTFEGGRITTAEGAAQHFHVRCDEAEVAAQLERDWKSGGVEETLARLLDDGIKVTSQADKLLQVARLKFLEPMLRHLNHFEATRLAHSSVNAADHLGAATHLKALGKVREQLTVVGGGQDEAMDYYKKAEQAYLAAGATTSADFATLLKSMGANLTNRGRYDEAMDYYKKAEQAYLAAGATTSADFATLLKSMGANLTNRGRYDEAMDYYKKAEQAYLAAGVPRDHPDFASVVAALRR